MVLYLDLKEFDAPAVKYQYHSLYIYLRYILNILTPLPLIWGQGSGAPWLVIVLVLDQLYFVPNTSTSML